MSKRLVPLLLLIAILGLFSLSSIRLSGRKPFWYDENNAYRQIVTSQGAIDLVIQGAVDQGSPAPLDYLLLKGLHGLRGGLGYLGLQPHQYLRLHLVAILWLVLLYLVLRTAKERPPPVSWLLVAAAAILLLNRITLWYSSEMRFYSLWMTLSFATLVLLEHRARSKIAWGVAVLALALTSTGAIVQLAALLGAVVLGLVISRRTLVPKVRIDVGLVILVIAIALDVYYIFRIPDYMHYPPDFWPTWGEFFAFWNGFLPPMLLGILLSAYHGYFRNEARLVGTLGATSWIAVGPIWFVLLLQSEYFFAPRQLIYYHAASAYLAYELLRTVFVDPKVGTRLKWVARAACVVLLSAYFTGDLMSGTKLLVANIAPNSHPAVPAYYERLAPLVPGRIPESYEIVPMPDVPEGPGREWYDEEAINETAETNLNLFWDYLEKVYPRDRFPRDPSTTLRLHVYNAYPACAAPCGSVFVEGVVARDRP
jgi:hypothetical protein